MKKLLASILAGVMLTSSAVALAACGDELPDYDYYGKTLSFTGAALSINWDVKCKRDDYPNPPSETEYSYRELLEKYYSKIDFDHEVYEGFKPWAETGKKVKNAGELISYIDENLDKVFEPYKDFSITFGAKGDPKCTLTVKDEGEEESMEGVYCESAADLAKYSGNFDSYSNLDTVGLPAEQSGKHCVILLDIDGNGKYDSNVEIILTRYVVNNEEVTVTIHGGFIVENNENGNIYYSYETPFGISEMEQSFILWEHPVGDGEFSQCSSLLTLPLYPQIKLS